MSVKLCHSISSAKPRLKVKQTLGSNLFLTMVRIRYALLSIGLDALWRLRPHRRPNNTPYSLSTDRVQEEIATLRSLIQRFPFWQKGRALLAERSILVDDVATAYAEAQALRLLSARGSPSYATALTLLGKCYLKRGDGNSALSLLAEASTILPKDFRIREEEAAAQVLVGDKERALEILQGIPTTNLSAEGKAALQWLSMK